jgi:hypothetical protein
MPDLTLKSGDTWPPLVTTLEDGGGPLDLTTAVGVTMKMASPTVSKTGLVCTITDASNGIVSYTWASGDTSAPGTYKVEFTVDFGTGKLQTAPNDAYREIVILAAVA